MRLTLADTATVHVTPLGSPDVAFEEVCRNHPDLRVEQTRTGKIVIMSPAGNESSNRNAKILAHLAVWAAGDKSGEVFDSNTVFALPDGSKLGPDAAWISRTKLEAFSPKEREQFLPVAPEFVIELVSPTDRISLLTRKMNDWISNGVELGWLIDADERVIWIYTKGAVRELHTPSILNG